MSTDTAVLNPAAFEMKNKIAELQQALLAQHPGIPNMLRKIHAQLRQDPEIVTLLDEEEIGVVVNGLMVQTATTIAATAEKASKSATAGLKAKISKAGSSAVDMF